MEIGLTFVRYSFLGSCRLLACLVFLFLPGPALHLQAAEDPAPRFADHETRINGSLVLRSIDFDSHPEARRYQGRLNELRGSGANFAGQYLLAYWGCGVNCQQAVIVRLGDGRVFFPPELVTSHGLCFRSDSGLLITNPLDSFLLEGFDGEVPDWLWTGYWLWQDGDLQLLHEDQALVRERCDF